MRSPSPPSSRQRNLSHEEPSWSTGGNSNSTTITKGKNTLRTSHPGSHHSSLHNQHHERSRMITDSDTDSVPDSDRSQQQQQLHRKASRESMSGRGSEPGSELDEEDSNRIKRHSYSNSSTPTTPVKRAKRNPSIKCPICHEYVTPGQYQQHYRMELAQLETGASNEV
ncbi:hypothetical protein F5H01DRAFT_148246 [Linnemannia elongata]|nr:hypothetical protein F5H01DRAFT_148246 [Linnemannia elongata]